MLCTRARHFQSYNVASGSTFLALHSDSQIFALNTCKNNNDERSKHSIVIFGPAFIRLHILSMSISQSVCIRTQLNGCMVLACVFY